MTVDGSHEHFMGEAIAEATAAGEAEDVPVGAVVVVVDADTGVSTIVGRGGNRRERDGDPTAHAEVVAIRQAAKHAGGWRILRATLYVTQEPCPMCAGAIVNARIDRVVYGCSNPKAGAARTLFQLLDDPRLNHRCEVVPGVLEVQSAALIKKFFADRRRPKGLLSGDVPVPPHLGKPR